MPADRIARVMGAKITGALGFAMLAAGMLLGATTSVGSSYGFVAAWMALVGAGLGLAMATAASAALSELPQERSGVGAAVMQAIQKVGAPFGAAILGSVLSSAYQAQLNLAGLPQVVANVVKESLFAGLAVAHQLGAAPLLESVRTAFVHGMDVSLVVAAGIAAAGIVLTLAFLPQHLASSPSFAVAQDRLRGEGRGEDDRRRALFGLLLALLVREAELPEADPKFLATLSSAANGRYAQTWSEARRGRAVAQDIIEPLSVLLLASSVSNGGGHANGAVTETSGETAPEAGEIRSTNTFIG